MVLKKRKLIIFPDREQTQKKDVADPGDWSNHGAKYVLIYNRIQQKYKNDEPGMSCIYNMNFTC